MSTGFAGGIEALKPIDEALDAHEAVGIWWAKAVLSMCFDNGGDELPNILARNIATGMALEDRSATVTTIGGFAHALAHVSREYDLRAIGVDYHADRALMYAAELAEMPANDMTTFPWKSGTRIENGIVTAMLGERDSRKQVWPPEQPSESI